MANFAIYQNKSIMATEFYDMQEIKRRFFSLRNGALGEMMRRQGAKYRIIFGLNLPQLVEISKVTPHDETLAQALWDNNSTRESMLLAPMIYPSDKFTIEIARKWASSIPTAEIADILCHKLLKNMPYASEFASELFTSDSDMNRYTALRLMFNLLPCNIDKAKAATKEELSRDSALTRSLCHALAEEIAFLTEGN